MGGNVILQKDGNIILVVKNTNKVILGSHKI